MRQSLAANRATHTAPPQTNAAAAAKLLEKKKEFDAVSALERASSLYLERIEGIGEDCDIMADAGQVHGQVLAQWPRMFQILNLFLASRGHNNGEDEGETLTSTASDAQRLVRIPIEELQQISDGTT
jgi:DASH complex subunit DAD2